MVCEAGDWHIVVEIEAEALNKRLRSIGFALILEAFGALAQIWVEDALQALLPHGWKRLSFALSHSLNIGSHHIEEFVEVGQCVAIQCARQWHSVFGADTIVFQAIQHVVMATALRKRYIAMHTYSHCGAIHISFVRNEHLAEVVCFARLLQDLALKVWQAREVPAGTATVLVLDTCDGVRLYNSEHRFVLVGVILFVLIPVHIHNRIIHYFIRVKHILSTSCNAAVPFYQHLTNRIRLPGCYCHPWRR